VFCSVLQCVAVCCSVLQCIAVCCSVLQCVAVCCSMSQCVAVRCSVLQCIAVCCSVYLTNDRAIFLENCSKIDFKLDLDHSGINVKVQGATKQSSSSSQTSQISTESRHATAV